MRKYFIGGLLTKRNRLGNGFLVAGDSSIDYSLPGRHLNPCEH